MSNGLNRIMLIGRAGTDPETRYVGEHPVASFRLGVSRSTGGGDTPRGEETEWFSITAWRKLADQVTQLVTKGRLVYVEGRVQTRTYEKDGVTHYRTEVVAHAVEMLDPKPKDGYTPGRGGPPGDEVELPF